VTEREQQKLVPQAAGAFIDRHAICAMLAAQTFSAMFLRV
jgi:hypothetical protein